MIASSLNLEMLFINAGHLLKSELIDTAGRLTQRLEACG